MNGARVLSVERCTESRPQYRISATEKFLTFDVGYLTFISLYMRCYYNYHRVTMALPKITVYMHTISACSIGDLEVSKLEIHMYVCSFVRTILRTRSVTVSHAVSMHVYMNCNVYELLQGRGAI